MNDRGFGITSTKPLRRRRMRGVREAAPLAPAELPRLRTQDRHPPLGAGSVLDRSCYTPPNTATLQILGLAIVPTMTSVGAVLSTLL